MLPLTMLLTVILYYTLLGGASVLCMNGTESISSRSMGPNPGFPPMKMGPGPMGYPGRYPLKHMPLDPLFLAPQIMANAVVPMAVSFSLGYLLFKLIALGFFILEKELAFTFGHMKMDQKIDAAQLGKLAMGQSANLIPILERVHKALDKYAALNKQ